MVATKEPVRGMFSEKGPAHWIQLPHTAHAKECAHKKTYKQKNTQKITYKQRKKEDKNTQTINLSNKQTIESSCRILPMPKNVRTKITYIQRNTEKEKEANKFVKQTNGQAKEKIMWSAQNKPTKPETMSSCAALIPCRCGCVWKRDNIWVEIKRWWSWIYFYVGTAASAMHWRRRCSRLSFISMGHFSWHRDDPNIPTSGSNFCSLWLSTSYNLIGPFRLEGNVIYEQRRNCLSVPQSTSVLSWGLF